MKILIVGGGNMGLTYARSFVRAHITSRLDLRLLARSPQRVAALAAHELGTVSGDPAQCVPGADIIILAVKPQDSPALFEAMRGLVQPHQVVLSIMAGVRIATLRDALRTPKVIRAMPNLPAQIGMGMTAFTSTDEVTRAELVQVQNLLSTTGKTVYVEEESAIDAATAISGSGPAYVYYCMDALMTAATQMGFTPAEAELLVSQTFRGAVELYSQSGLSCTDWIAKVASKGGTTEAAMHAFGAGQVREGLVAGAAAARDRAEELGK
ncbi:pyrroline-5-carboxylate reductase [Hymenobacter sedentarius]|uniref:Pyrroline-5-carboxylate reductase n=1 Tax=Hymenobacter sedentarius TaxID=1411621 RepID=A0A0U4BPC6_9BACT|nr:pyrroline-5-carboxylate reductase [Hymenobacter sedentarius]ALW85610.1 pyrroline-5-carboxylate reductase [Hymenobacter sedentarius]